MARPQITRSAVLRTIEEFDERGREDFLRHYGYGEAKKYFLVHDGRHYDTKALAGVAHQIGNGYPLPNDTFTGGLASVVRQFEQLGFVIYTIEDLESEVPDLDLDSTASPEGKLLERRHLIRERSPRLRQQKIDQALSMNSGSISCEVCGFDFAVTYGEVGRGFAECHHVVPLHVSGATVTKLADLAILCANCHRMIHRHTPWLTPSELRERIEDPENHTLYANEKPGCTSHQSGRA